VLLTDINCHISKQIHLKASTSFKRLLQTDHQPSIKLEFITPTAFKQGKKTIQPFPLPELVFGSLLRRWNVFAPEDLHFPQVEWQGMVSAFDLKTQVLRLEGGPQIGSVGWVRYRFPDAEQARIASILAQYAFFAGVGYKTTMGMGQVQPLT
jgi:CRISPR-associated endoribonuclease Cas6